MRAKFNSTTAFIKLYVNFFQLQREITCEKALSTRNPVNLLPSTTEESAEFFNLSGELIHLVGALYAPAPALLSAVCALEGCEHIKAEKGNVKAKCVCVCGSSVRKSARQLC